MKYEIIKQSTLENPLVSIIVPMYNVEDYIEKTIQSILGQTLKSIELILLDDGSVDNTVEIVERFTSDYDNVTIVLKDNTGPGSTRNLGIELSRGEYISFVDSDDMLPMDASENLYNAAIEKNADLVTGMSQSFNSEKKWFIASHLNSGAYEEGYKNLLNNPEMLYTIGPCNKMYKRELISDISFPAGIKVTEDHPFVIHAYLKAKNIYTLDKIIYLYRNREDDDNLSLSQIVNVNSANVVVDIFNSLKVSDEFWSRYNKNEYKSMYIKIQYYNRIIKADLWPAINKSLKNRNNDDQVVVFTEFRKWVEQMDRSLFNKLPLISHIITFQTLNRYTLLSEEAKKIHMSILKTCYEKLDPDTISQLLEGSRGKEIASAFKSAKRNSSIPMYTYLTKRRIKRIKQVAFYKLSSDIAKKVVFNFAKLLPINKNKIMFATNKDVRFHGSFEVVYRELMKREHNYDVVAHFKMNRKFKELCKLYYDLATSKYVLLDDYYNQLYGLKTREQTEVVQLWHAAGAFKKFGMSSIGAIDSNSYEFEKNAHQNYKKVIVSGEEVAGHYAEAFGVSEKNVEALGVPRTDLFFDEDYKKFIKEKYYETYPILKDKKIVGYTPTFRGRPGARSTFNLELDIKLLREKLGDDYIIVLKLHPSVTKAVHIPEEYQDFVLNLSKNDINNVLIMSDILITDYSSIVFDYALLNRPMIFFAYDLEEYLDERGFYYEYREFVPGPIAKNTDQITNLILEGKFDSEKNELFKHKFFDSLDGKSGKRVVEYLFFKK